MQIILTQTTKSVLQITVKNVRYRMLPSMTFMFILTLTCIFNLCPTMNGETIESASDELDTYIVHLNVPTDKPNDLESWYNTFLPTSATNSNKKQHMVHSYRHVATGFAVKLSPEDAKEMEKKDGVVSVRPQRVFSLHTTRSPRFLGLHQNLGFWRGSNYGKGIIIGLLDTGITPGHPSFSDKGMPPPPTKWKGKCDNGTVCNNKLIGARNFIKGEVGPPLDDEGHGTHTASTAAGNFVKDANVFGMAFGTAVGMAPLSHVAMYKVCGESGCFESDILAGMDTAIEDGVDVLSLSLGGISLPFFDDGIAVGAFKAIQKGIFVSCSAGNSGPYNASLSNEAPWILTVGASIIDRTIRAAVLLGDKTFLDGESLFQPKDFNQTLIPLVYPGINGDQATQWCAKGSLKSSDVKGKIVLCQRGGGIARIAKGQTVKDAGGAAMILMNAQIDGDSTLADAHVLPASHVGYDVGSIFLAYINSTSSPVATIIFKGTISEGVDWAPQMTSFSSRGPNMASPGILKPDITGPGVSILAAWPFSVDNNTKSTGPFNVVSGTSMSCPHLGGIAALLKSVHPDWTPAAIKSAIMTTALLVSRDKQPIEDERDLPADLFAVGAGHVNPTKAADPGLVYDIQPDDYIPYLCGLGYNNKQIAVITGKQVTCTNQTTISEAELNYPSFAIKLGSGDGPSFTRTVTNVGAANSSYTVEVIPPPGVTVTVGPSELTFSKVGQKLSYAVTFQKEASGTVTPYVEGSLTWKSVRHSVRSPISVNFV